MNTQKLQQHILIPLLLVGAAFFAPALAQASTIEVVFEQTPLFANSNMVPGSTVSRTVTVTNTGSDSAHVQVAVANEVDNGLASGVNLAITDPSPTTHYSDTFLAFFGAVPVSLGNLAGGESRVYTFAATIDAEAGNEYQGKSMGFDLVVGFEGGESNTDNGGGGGNGGGGSSGGSSFSVFNEEVESIDLEEGVVLSWNTNRDATTYLVCGALVNGPFTLTTNEGALFGYDFDISEDTDRTENHEVLLTGLGAGEYECRPASREDTDDAFTVGSALTFTIPTGEVQGDNFFGVGGAFPFGLVESAEASTGEDSGSDMPEGAVEGIAASVVDTVKDVFTDAGATCTGWWLLLLPLMSLLWNVVRQQRAGVPVRLTRTIMYDGALILFIIAAALLDLAQTFWWLFALVWALYITVDYHNVRKAYLGGLRLRNMYFIVVSLGIVILSQFVSFICYWWPFALIAGVSILLLFFDESEV